MNLKAGTLAKLRSEVRSRLPPNGTHGFEHTERVYETCVHIGEMTGADMSILLPAALLHDVARDSEAHAETGAATAGPILRELGFTDPQIQAVQDAIRSHSFSAGQKPSSVESMVLSDADKLDAMGAVGVYRAAQYSGENPRPIGDFVAHFHEKLLRLRELVYTEEAKRMADERTHFLLAYLDQLSKELRQTS